MYIYIHMCMLSCESDARTWPEGGTLCGYKSSVVACRWMKRKSASQPTPSFHFPAEGFWMEIALRHFLLNVVS